MTTNSPFKQNFSRRCKIIIIIIILFTTAIISIIIHRQLYSVRDYSATFLVVKNDLKRFVYIIMYNSLQYSLQAHRVIRLYSNLSVIVIHVVQ